MNIEILDGHLVMSAQSDSDREKIEVLSHQLDMESMRFSEMDGSLSIPLVEKYPE